MVSVARVPRIWISVAVSLLVGLISVHESSAQDDFYTMRIGELRNGVIEERSGSEVWDLVIESRTAVEIHVRRIHGSTIDPKVTLYRGEDVVGTDDDGGEGLNSRLIVTLDPGTYELLVEAVGTSTGEFEVEVIENIIDILGVLDIGSAETETLESGEQHYFEFRSQGQQRIAISVDRVFDSALDPKVALYTEYHHQVGMNDDGGEGNNALLTVDVESGLYFIVVTGFGSTSGRYTVAVNEAQESEQHHLGSLSIGSSRSGELAPQEQHRYSFNSTRSQDLVFTVDKTPGSTLDPKVTVYGEADQLIGTDDDGGDENNARLITPVGHGYYTIAVSGFGTTSGGYRVAVNEVEIASMGVVSVGSSEEGTLSEAGERHTYQLRITRSGRVVIRLDQTAGSTLDPKMELRRGSERLVVDDDGGEGRNARISRTLSPGSYEIVAFGFGSTTGSYRLVVEEEETQQSRSIHIGGRVLDSIVNDDEVDRYSLFISEQQTLVIQVQSVLHSGLDPAVVIYSSDGSEVASDDDGGEGYNSRLRHTFSPGEYEIAVRGVGTSTGDYRLEVTETEEYGGELDGGSSTGIGETNLILVGEGADGRIDQPRQQRRYTLVLNEQTSIVIRLNKTGDMTLDPRMTLESGNGDEIVSNDDGGEGVNSLIRRDLQAGRYIIVAHGYSETVGDYELIVERETVSVNDLGTITYDRVINSEIGDPNERDTYRFTLESFSQVSLSMNRVGQAGVDPYLELYEAGGEQITVNDDGGAGVNSLIEQRLQPGSYRLVARSFGSATGPYELTVSAISATEGMTPTNDLAQGEIAIGQTRQGEIASLTTHLWTLDVATAGPVSISLTHPAGSSLDPRLGLLDGQGTEIASNDDGGEGMNALIREELSPGRYTIVASGYARTSGAYELSVEGIAGGASILSFDNDDHGMGTENTGDVERGVAIGKYSFRSLQHDNRCWSLSLGRKGDGIYRVNATKMAGPDSKGYGIAFRVHGRGDVPNMYLFEINANGQFRFRRRQNTDWTDIVRWTTADCIEKGEYAQNTLQIEADGSRYVFTINGTLVSVAHDTEAAETFSEGFVGFTVSEGLHILFDNMEVPQ